MDLPPHDPARCLRCGVCCMLTVRINDRAVAVPDLACRHLRDLGGGRHACAVYGHRHEAAPWCQTVPTALAMGVLARDCPFARDAGRDDGPVRLSAAQARRMRPALLETLGTDWPEWLDPPAATATRPSRDPRPSRSRRT